VIAPDPVAVIGGRDATEQLLARLSSDDRELLVAAAWDGFSARELGELLGCSEATARQRQSRLLRRLRAELGTPEGGLP
jgi:RNA polymerase sigma factor (sigma-70 family)